MTQRGDRIGQQAVGRRSHGPARPVRSSASFEAVAAAPAGEDDDCLTYMQAGGMSLFLRELYFYRMVVIE